MVVPAASSACAPAFRAQAPSGPPARPRAPGSRRGRAVPVPFGGRPLRAIRGRRLVVVRASADEPRRDSGDSGDSAPPPAGAYAGWWTRADAAAALAVAAERDGDDDAVRLEDASRALSPPAAPWLELLELSATFGAAGGGLAALLLQETALVALVAALPLVAYGARAKRDALARRFAAEAILEAREETECAVKKAAALGFATNVASTAATEAVRLGSAQTSNAVEAAVNKGVFAIKRDLVVLEGSVGEKVARGAEKDAERVTNSIDALSRSVASASASALRAAKESGSVAGMLAKDVAASRVDAREQFELLAGLFAESAENAELKNGDARDDVLTELGVLSETLSRLEKSLEKSESEERDERLVRDDGVTDDVERDGSEKSSAEKEKRVRDSAESLEALSRAASAAKAAAVAAERAAAAAEKASSLSASASSRDDSSQLTPVVAKLDAEQWALLGARLTQLETAAAAAAAEAAAEAGRAVGRVRAGVREDIRGASDALAAAAEAAGTRAEGSEPPPAPSAFPPVFSPLEVEPRRVSDRAVSPARRAGPKRDDPRSARARPGAERRDERVERGDQADAFPSDFSNGLPFEFAERVAVPAAEAASASAFGRIAAEAALREDAETETRDGLPPINAAVGLTKEAAFENMQALLREKSVAKKKAAPRTKNTDDANARAAVDAKASAGPKNENETPIDTANENDSNEDVTSEKSDWSARPVRVSLSVGPDGRVVATLATRAGEVFPGEKKNRSEAATTTDADADADADATAVKSVSARSQLDEGLASLRAARVAARDAGSNPSRMLEADADAAAAIAALETAAETFGGLVEASLSDASSEDEASSDASSSDASSSNAVSSLIAGEAAARGNLGNALLARGRLQVRLSSMAASQERRAAASGVRAGAEGAAAFHAEIAEECLVLAGRAFRKALALSSSRLDDEEARGTDGGVTRLQKTNRGAARALTGWGAALALRGSVVLQSAKNASSARAFAVSASEAASLAAAASEKYRAALELDEDETETSTSESATKTDVSNGCFTASARARLFVDWGDALRLAASASADALAASSAPGFEPGAPGEAFFFDTQRLPPPGECWARAEACYREAERWDDEGCGSDARRGLRACEDAFR